MKIDGSYGKWLMNLVGPNAWSIFGMITSNPTVFQAAIWKIDLPRLQCQVIIKLIGENDTIT